MRRMVCFAVVLAFLSAGAWAAEVGLVTALSGNVRLQDEKSVVVELKPFVKVREGDRLTLQGNGRLQIVFFDGGRQESWQGSGALEVGNVSSKAVSGSVQAEVKTLPAILVRQLAKTPSPDGSVKAGMIRMRSVSTVDTLESVERNYADLRKQVAAADRSPELYLLASYLELREFTKLEGLLKQLGDRAPGDPQLDTLSALYARAISSAKTADRH